MHTRPQFVVRIEMGPKHIELTEQCMSGLKFHVRTLNAILDKCDTVDDFDRQWDKLLLRAMNEE